MNPSTILAFAGRRIDAHLASPGRFPLSEVDRVYRQVEIVLQEQRVTLVVGSAACGADLIVLQVAHQIGIRFRILLPCSPELFRVTSVVDRPWTEEWNWGRLYDQFIDLAHRVGDLQILEGLPEGHLGYQAVTEALVRESIALGERPSSLAGGYGSAQVQALMIWDGQSRGPHDLTLHFAEEARAQGLPLVEILTCSTS